MKEAHKFLIGNILLIHPFAHQYKGMMKEVFCTIQKRNTSSFSFGWLLYVNCASPSRFHEIGNTFVRTKVQLAKQSQVCKSFITSRLCLISSNHQFFKPFNFTVI